MHLTKRSIEALTYDRDSGGQYAWDDDLSGFGVRVYPSGRKSFVITYRVDGRQRFYTIGRVGKLTLKQARVEALQAFAATTCGGDPAGDREARRQAPELRDLAQRYLRDHAQAHKKPSGVKADENMWKKHVLPRLARRRVADITRADIAGLHAEMAATPYQANRTLALLSKAFNLAEVWGWRPDGTNPCKHIQRFREEKRERYLSDDEFIRLAEALDKAEQLRTEFPAAIAAIRLLVLTGCRSGEIKSLQWSEVDFKGRCLRLTDSKTGRRTVYLNSSALDVLSKIERQPYNPYVIVGQKPGSHLIGLTRSWYRLRKAAGLDDVRLHDLRHSYASVAAASGLSLPMIGKLLGHTQPITTQRYAHLAADPMLQASEHVGAAIGATMRQQPKAPILTLPRPYSVSR